MPVVISFTADQTAAIHDITFLAVKHNGVFVRIERPKSRDEDSIWNQWLMTDNVYRSIRIDIEVVQEKWQDRYDCYSW